jgi:hypothetical protein
VHHRDRVAVLETEGEKLSDLVEKEKQQIETLEQIIAVIDRSERDSSINQSTSFLSVRNQFHFRPTFYFYLII